MASVAKALAVRPSDARITGNAAQKERRRGDPGADHIFVKFFILVQAAS